MKKLIFVITIVAAVMFFKLGVSACEVDQTRETEKIQISDSKAEAKVEKLVAKANKKIDKKIENAVAKSETIVEDYENGDITEKQKDKKIDRLVQKLLDQTNAISEKTRNKCAELGYEVICEWIPVEIDGEIIMVDPIYIKGKIK